jgi:uncharacterized damage-inducible protein DinB
MITPEYARLMARYNAWQNRSLYGAADGLTDAQRRENRGAFFGSIHATLAHTLFGDRIWMHRLAGTPKPVATKMAETLGATTDWQALKREREDFDEVMIKWADGLDAAALEGPLTYYSGATGRQATRPRWLLVTHMFNHATHHRGQAHCLLTGFGCKPDDTDLPLLPT